MKTMTQNLPTVELARAGQSPWLDTISRELLKSGKLKNWINQSGLLGVTSNPSIFEKAINQPGGGYDADIKKLLAKGAKTFEVYDALTISDIQAACDLFQGVYKSSKGEHGFVSLEVAPSLAYDTQETISEGLRLYKAVNRPNVMIKVPATLEGIPAIRALIGKGVNINVTLIFALKHYEAVANAYLAGLEDLIAAGGDPRKVHSVASVFVSRIDTFIDKKLDNLAAETLDAKKKAEVLGLRGQAAIANSKVIYQSFKKILSSERWKKLQAKGATIQKVLWGSTSTKNPAYSDLIYVDNLIGKETVNTMPQNTFEAVLDHGKPRENSIEENISAAQDAIKRLAAVRIDVNEVCERLQKDGVRLFIESFDQLMRSLESARERFRASKKASSSSSTYTLQGVDLTGAVSNRLAEFEAQGFLSRFLQKDPAVWKKESSHQEVINNRLGWLKSFEWLTGKLYEIDAIQEAADKEKVTDLVLLGMGGSSLAPEVMSLICKRASKKRRFWVLDTTDPVSVAKVRKAISIKSTWFVVASKSGSTVETMSQYQYFFAEVSKASGAKAGTQFIAITDSGSSLEKLAGDNKFRKIFINPTDIGGRYSALSFFGMVPAALIGVDVRALLRSASAFYAQTEKGIKLAHNHGIHLGVIMGELAKMGRTKMTLIASKSLASFATWTEQLIAESTGKEGKGIVPVEGEAPAKVEAYGQDRYFVFMRLKSESVSKTTAEWLKSIKAAKFPLIEMVWQDDSAIGGEFLHWEIATVVSSAVIGVNPFDELNVRESKENTGKILGELKVKGKLPQPKGLVKTDAVIPFENALGKIKKGSYLAILAYTERSEETTAAFNRVRQLLSESLGIPVLVGFGPRYLHSIGQLYKGGTLNGIFIEFFTQDQKDLAVPGAHYTFGQLKRAQALGDLEALESKGLPVLTVELGSNLLSSVSQFEKKLALWLKTRK